MTMCVYHRLGIAYDCVLRAAVCVVLDMTYEEKEDGNMLQGNDSNCCEYG